MSLQIPFNKPYVSGQELEYVTQAIATGKIAADGQFTMRCARFLESQFAIHKVLMTPSCTAALEIAAMLCDLRAGDEVIMPSYTFVSTANAVVRLGARPVFVDIRPDTLNIDEMQIEAAITPKTKAICPVHYAGVGCEMDTIMSIAQRHNLLVVEDAAQAVNASYRGRALGSIGHLGAYSFHDTKNYVCGEGGALCVNDARFVERAEIIREKGTNRSRFLRGMVDKYTWVDIGSSYVPNEIANAFLCAQLELLEPIARRREEIYEFYYRQLQPLAECGWLQLPTIPADCRSNHHMFYVTTPSLEARDGLIAYLKEQGIGAVFHYVPLHSAPVGQRFGYRAGDLPTTEDLSSRLVRLPLYYSITEAEQAKIVSHIKRLAGHSTASKAA